MGDMLPRIMLMSRLDTLPAPGLSADCVRLASLFNPACHRHLCVQCQIDFPLDTLPAPGLSADCVDLLSRMLKTNPSQRYTMPDIQRHPWFTSALPGNLPPLM